MWKLLHGSDFACFVAFVLLNVCNKFGTAWHLVLSQFHEEIFSKDSSFDVAYSPRQKRDEIEFVVEVMCGRYPYKNTPAT